MASGSGCGRGAGAPSSSDGDGRGEAASPRRGRPFALLRRRSDLLRVLRMGRRCESAGLVVVEAPGVPGPPRITLIAGKDVGTAVDRNRVKRRLREALYRVGLTLGTDYVVIATEEVKEADFDELVRWLRDAVEG